MRKPYFSTPVFIAAFLISSILIAGAPVKTQEPEPSQTTAHAIQLYQQGDAAGAIKILREVVEKHPDDADAWYYLGLAFYSQDAIGLARSPFENLIKLRPTSAEGHAKLAYSLILANQPERSLAIASRAIELGDLSAEPHYAIAESHLRLNGAMPASNSLQKTLQEAETALQINPGFSLALITKALAHVQLKQYPEAATAFERLVDSNPNDLDAETWRSQLEEMRSRSVAAVQPAVETARTVHRKVQILSKPEPQYTDVARMAAVQGTVVLRAVLTAEGEVKHVTVIRALGFGLTTQAINAARKIKFVPALKDDKAVSMQIQLEYNFNLY